MNVPVAAAKKVDWRDISGIILLDKPLGMSSHGAVQRVRRILRARRGGHTGSLDPLATGMLPVCLGEATKFAGLLLESSKTYRVRMVLGARTASGDLEGPVVETGPSDVPAAVLEDAMAAFRGQIWQVPPMYSALKQGGRPLYELARKGVVVDRPARPVVISRLVRLPSDGADPVLEVTCSKGTYIRTLVEDIARACGTVAHVGELRRTAVEPFGAVPMVSLEALEAVSATSPGGAHLLPVDSGLTPLPRLVLEEDQVRRLRQGQLVAVAEAGWTGVCRLYDQDGGFLGLGDLLPGGALRPKRLMATENKL